MMNCAEARRVIDADPAAPAPPALEEHLRGCEACTRWQREMRALEGAIRRALDIDLPEASVASVVAAQSSPALVRSRAQRLRPWAMAAGLLVALAAGAFLWIARPAA